MSFSIHWVALCAFGLPLVFALGFSIDFTRRRRTVELVASRPALRRMAASVSWRRRTLKAVMVGLGVTLCVAAMAKPEVEGESEWLQRGIDIAVVIDASSSMMAADIYPSRFGRSRIAAKELLERLGADRAAVVMYGGTATFYPLTHDADAAKLLLDGVSPADLASGSDLGEGMRVGRCLLSLSAEQDPSCRDLVERASGGDALTGQPALRPLVSPEARGERGAAMVVFTDGDDTGGRALDEVRIATRAGIDVFLVGMGTRVGAPVPELGERGNVLGFRDADGDYIVSALDAVALRKIADGGDGRARVIVPGPLVDASELSARLDRIKRGDLDSRVVRHRRNVYYWLLFPGFMLLVIEACIGERSVRRTLGRPR